MKKRFYLLLILSMLFVTGCRNDDPTPQPQPPVENGGNENGGNENGGNENGGNENGGNENGGNENGGNENEEVTIIKNGDSFELEIDEQKEIDLTQYFNYSGTKYSYVILDEDKDIVEYEILNNKLTIIAKAKGIEKITVTLNDKSLEFTITVAGAKVEPLFDAVDVQYDLKDNTSLEVTLAPKEANGYTEFVYTLKEANQNVTINENKLTVAITEVCEKTIVVVCEYAEEQTVEITVNIKVVDTTYDDCKVVNGSFDKDLEGWTLAGEIGAITEESTFWNQGFEVSNVGKYFSGAINGLEVNEGTLTSSPFKLGGTGYVTFMLGAAGNENCYITVLDENNNILAIYRNTEFRDLTPEHNNLPVEQQKELIGTEVNTLNLVKYKADLSAHIGKEVKLVINDNATSGFGFVTFDELVTFHTEVPGDEYKLAENQIADLTEINELIEVEVKEQGDYTLDSFNAYKAVIANAKDEIANAAITQAKVNSLAEAITQAYNSLAVREVELKEVSSELTIITNRVLTINCADYFDTKELSSITYNCVSEQPVTVEGQTVKFDATGLELGEYTVKVNVLYKGEVQLSVDLTIEVIAKPEVLVKEETVEKDLDIYFSGNEYEIDLSSNVTIVGGLELSYVVNEEAVNGNVYMQELTVGEHTIEVKATYEYEGTHEITYTIKLNVTDTTAYRVVNGSFDKDLEGWTLNGEEIGAITENSTWWAEGLPMFNVGKYFSAYGNGDLEEKVGTLTSSTFKLGGNGYITFMLGGAGNENCYITILDKEDNIVAIYRNTEFENFPGGFVLGEHIDEGKAMIGNTVNLANLIKYKADLSAHIGKELKVVINDNATGGWGLVFFDELSTYHTEVPGDDYILAENQLADTAELKELVAALPEIAEQGDYTEESYNAYKVAYENAKNGAANVAIKQAKVELLVNALKQANEELALRQIELIENETEYRVIVGQKVEISYNDFFNTNNLSSVELKYESELEFTVEDNVLVLDTTGLEIGEYTVTLNALYKDEVKQTVELKVVVIGDYEAVAKAEIVEKALDIYFAGNEYEIDLSANVTIVGDLELTYYVNDEVVEDNTYKTGLVVGTQEIKVKATYEYEGTHEISYTIKLNVTDTTAYRAANGSFDKDLEGWTLAGEIGGITENSTFWGENYPIYNVGKYFSAYAQDGLEPNVGTLTSSTFTLGGNGYITFMLGGAGNENCYITVLDKDDNILAIYRNTEFKDISDEDKLLSVEERRELIGERINLANLVKYKADLSAHLGKELKVVINDNATGGWGVVFFDELSTYHTEVPSNDYVLAENQLADLTEINELIAAEIAEQGDYTAESFEAYKNTIANAKEAINNAVIKQTVVDSLALAITEAYEGLKLRTIEVKEADAQLMVVVDKTLTINCADYFDTKELSSVTYSSESENVTIEGSNLKFDATGLELDEIYLVTINALYNGEEQASVELEIEVIAKPEATVKASVVTENLDIYLLGSEYEIDLSSNVSIVGDLTLKYYVGEQAVEGETYKVALTEGIKEIQVKATYEYEGSNEINYTINLNVKDTTKYRLQNGDFENGLTGWTKVGNIGSVSADTHYWIGDSESADGFAFGMDGEQMFSAYAPGAEEAAVGTLTSSSFTVGGSGFVTFKLGAMKDGNYVYVDVVDADTKEILARYYNGLWAEKTDDVKSGCTLIAYKADLSAYMGKNVFFRISDNANSGYGLFFTDSFITYYENEPDGFNVATPVEYEVSGTIYDIFNGGFEMGGNQGWWNVGEIGVVTNASGFWAENISYNKNGDYLFTGVESFGADTMREGNRGALTSSTFEIGGTGYISFMLGGGGSALCYVQVIDAVTGEILARYHQQAQNDAVLIQYVADLSAYIGRIARIQVVDQADSGWGCVSFDNVVTYYPEGATLPTGTTATDIKGNIKYTIDNGSFETGNLDGWTMNITEAGAHNTLGWVESTEHDAGWYTKNDDRKDGNNLFTFAKPDGTNCENTKGTLDSSIFTLKQGSYVSFRFGGAGTRDVHIQLCRADGSVIATFYNEAPGKINTEMYAYYYQYTGDTTECFFRVVDNSTGNYGCFVVDDFRVNLDAAPEGFIKAIQ